MDDPVNQLRLGRVSRRDFGKLALASGMGATLAGNLLTSAARAATPKRGGSFRFGSDGGSTTDSLDPGLWNNNFTAIFGLSFFGATLTEVDQKSDVKPNLAESFETTDGSKWVFKLRRGLTFHDGKSLTPADVIATINFHRAPDSKSAAKSLLGAISDMKADGPDTVIFQLSAANVDFPYLMSDYHLPIYPAADGGGIDWKKGIGAGPYILQSYQPGVQATGKRNPNYHKSGMPYFDDVTMLTILDDSARANALVSGDTHYLSRVNFNTIDLLKRNSNIEVDSVTGTYQYQAPMNVTMAPFDNADVRSAVKWSIDRQELVNKIVRGYGIDSNDDPISPNTKFYAQPQPVYKYDPDKVKFHLKRAGFDRIKLDFSVSDAAFGGAVDAAVLMQASAAKAGIDINVIRESNDGYWDNVWMKKAWCMSYWGGRPTCDYAFSTLFTADAAWNDSFWKNPRFNDLVKAARSEIDQSKRAEMYREAQQLLHDDGGAIILLFKNNVWAHTKAVAHGDLAANYDNDGGRVLERWWFA